ncbi:MAG: hypothetical protein PHV52_00050 [Aliarcobacter sp.]|nr:hypothetical protein [Aliarcobacter sp.]
MTREEANIWIENTFSDFTKEEDREESISFLVKRIFDDFEKNSVNKEDDKCKHINGRPSYEYWICSDCGSIKTDSNDSWGIAKNKWFNNESEAKFYKNNGYLPK